MTTFLENYELYKPISLSILKSSKAVFPLQFVQDLVIMHMKPWSSLLFNPKAKTPWKKLLQKYYLSEEYKKLNEVIAGDPLLAKYAVISILTKISQREEVRAIVNQTLSHGPGQSAQASSDQKISAIAKEMRGESNKIVEDIETLKDLQQTMKSVRSTHGYSNEGIPLLSFLEKPEEMRRVLSNKILVSFVRLYKSYKQMATSFASARIPTTFGGIPVGIKTIQKITEIPRTLPQEIIDEEIFSMKFATKTLKVTENYGALRDAVVYIDKSGSMDGNFGRKERVPKISFAAASALALAHQLRKNGAKMTLKFFDVYVHKEVSDYNKIIEELLKVKADSGTNITRVLEDAMNYPEKKVIVISDGIDSIDEEVCKKAKRKVDLKAILIETDNEVLRRYFDCFRIEEPSPIVLKI